ncbi:TfoX/Sxy family protein [Aquincola sp. MAHUQ-54]|uniref:TfoX/Sxy family protein n=1 Tax=Aquincola agrisoli TaxID=3119538 RepID=A0AAW9Q5F1_9BURK
MRATAPADPIVAHCLELLAPLGDARARRMFGGHGIYLDGHFIAIVAWERLYLKANEATQARFREAGCEPFTYEAKGDRRVTMNYWTAPAEAMESPALMQPWARLALQAALAAPRPRQRR